MSIIDPHSAATAIGLVNSAFSSVKTALELAKKTTDLDLKQEVSNAFDNVVELKVKVWELTEENRQLRDQLEQQKTVKYDSAFGYYFKEDDPVPLCPKCYEDKQGVRHLSQPENVSGGTRRKCFNCDFEKWEKPMQRVTASYAVSKRSRTGWMGN